MKDRGALIKPSDSVVKVCEETEKCFQAIQSAVDGSLPLECGVDMAIAMAVLRRIPVNEMFITLNEHMLEGSVTDNHIFQLIQTTSLCFSKIRLHHMAKQSNEKANVKKIRKVLTRLVIFKNQ